MKLALRIGIAATFLFVLLGGTASAAPGDAPGCTPADQADITGVLNTAGDQATFAVHNATPLCAPAAIGMAVYLKDADGFVLPQTLFGSATGEITSGTQTLSLTLPVNGEFPKCFTQMDAFVGPVIQDLSDSNLYDDRLRDTKFGETQTCAEVEAESTTTSTTTTTITEDTNPPSEPPKDEVLADEVERPALARTGPRVDVTPLLAAAGILLIIGAASITASRSHR